MSVQIIDEQDSPVDRGMLQRLARMVLAAEGYGTDCMVDVTLVSDKRIKEMNRRHRRRGEVTDVLAFPLQDMEPGNGRPPGGANQPPLHLGDVVIAPGFVNGQAARAGWRYADEMGLMAVHGVLHLLGYRHDTDTEAAIMEEEERRHLATEGLQRR